MKIDVVLTSSAAPLQLEVSVGERQLFYRDRHDRWQVEDEDSGEVLDSGASSLYDGPALGLFRCLQTVDFAYALEMEQADYLDEI